MLLLASAVPFLKFCNAALILLVTLDKVGQKIKN